MAAKKRTTKKTTGRSRSTAQRRTTAKKSQQESIFSKFRKEIWGVVCLLLAVVILLSGFDRGSIIARLFCGLFGEIGLTVLPIGLTLCFIALVFHGGHPVTARIVFSLSFVLLVCAIYHLARDASEAVWGKDIFRTLYAEGKEAKSGGVFGGLLAMIFSLLGGRPVSWAICIILLVVALPSSLNLTMTGLLRAINNRREQRAKERGTEEPEEYREPAEVLVEHMAQRRQEHAERKLERAEKARQKKRFDFDLPVDDPPEEEKPEPKKKRFDADADLFSDPLPEQPRKTVRPKRVSPDEEQTSVPENAPTEKVPVRPAEPEEEKLPPIEQLPSDKVKPREAAVAAAQIGKEIEESEQAPQPVYVYPPVELLNAVGGGTVNAQTEMRENSRRLTEKLRCFNIDAEIINVTRGPSVTMYELQLPQGVRLQRITSLADDIALELGSSGVRISAIPDRNSVVGIEVPNKNVSMVKIREVVDSAAFRGASSTISFAVGKDISGNCIVGDIAKMPHVLVAGTTGSGKSVCMNSLIVSLLYKSTPEDCKLIMVDPKMVEFGIYNGIPQLLVPVVTDAKKAAGALQWTVTEMMRRYSMLGDAGTRDIESYNKLAASNPADYKHLPQIVVLIDELADLMLVAGKEVEESICRIAQMGRASGIHLVIATQRPSADVITGLMKANIPSRIAFAVSSAMESRIILDTPGAEKLIGKGDMLFAPLGKGKPKRVQGCFIDDAEVERVVSFVKQHSSPNYSDDVQAQIELKAAQTGKGGAAAAAQDAEASEGEDGDELLPAAVEVILETKQASVSMLQRRLKLGYARAARIVDEMEERGIVGPYEGSKPRQLLITREQWDAMRSGGASEADENPPVEEEIP